MSLTDNEKDILAKEFASKILELKSKGLSEEDIASYMGVDYRQVNNYKNRIHEPKLSGLGSLRKNTGIDLNEMVDNALGKPLVNQKEIFISSLTDEQKELFTKADRIELYLRLFNDTEETENE